MQKQLAIKVISIKWNAQKMSIMFAVVDVEPTRNRCVVVLHKSSFCGFQRRLMSVKYRIIDRKNILAARKRRWLCCSLEFDLHSVCAVKAEQKVKMWTHLLHLIQLCHFVMYYIRQNFNSIILVSNLKPFI